MFGQLLDVQSWTPIIRRALIAFAALMLGPGALLVLGMLGLMLVPVAVVGVPFMLPAFFGGAVTEHGNAAARASVRPPAHAPLLAS